MFKKSLLFGIVNSFSGNPKINRWLNSLLKFTKYSLITFLFFSIIIMYTPLANELPRPLFVEPEVKEADVIVVLGSGIYTNGYLSWDSLLRTFKGSELYKAGYAKKILFSGRSGSDNLPEEISLAKSMAEVAKQNGIPNEAILLENSSRNTYENAINTAEIMKREGFKTALLVTSASHMKRAKLVFEHAGVEVIPAPVFHIETYIDDPIERVLLFRAVMREYIGLELYEARGWI